MKTKEVQQKLLDIDQSLKSLGDLSALIQSFNEQKHVIDALIAEVQAQKANIDAIPQKKEELEALVAEVTKLREDTLVQQTLTEETKKTVDILKDKSEDIHNLSLQQLGVISNEKLSNSFDRVKDDLKNDNEKWFKWLVGTSIVLLFSVIVIVIWQVAKGDTIFEISFLVKLALTSPIIFFEFFVNREYSRSKRLKEEYEFKASIARSLEAYKEIIENLFADHQGEEYKKKLDFILESIGQLYSSPMRNIKDNELNDERADKKITPILSDVKDIVSSITGVVSRIK